MPLQEEGIKFVSKGFGEFISNMSKAAASIANLGSMTQNRLQALREYNVGMAEIAKTAVKMVSANAKIIDSNNKVTISNNQAAISANKLAQEEFNAAAKITASENQVIISNNRLEIAQANLAYQFERMANVNKMVEAFIAGKLNAQELVAAINGVNGVVARLGKASREAGQGVIELSGLMNKSWNNLKQIYSAYQDLNKVLNEQPKKYAEIKTHITSVIGSYIKLGAVIGGLAGTLAGALSGIGLIPVTGGSSILLSGLLPMAGAITGALLGLSASIGVAVKDFVTITIQKIVSGFEAIAQAVIKYLPKLLQVLATIGTEIVKILYNIIKGVVSAVGKVLSAIGNALQNLFQTIFGMFTGGAGGGGWRSLGSSIFTAMFKFEVLKQVIRKVVEVFKDFSKEAFQAAQELQVLTIRFDNLIASQIRSYDKTMDYNKSLGMAGAYTKDLLQWVQRLALATPISIDDISRMTYLSMAMGWSVTQAKSLTKAIVDYTATLGMGSEISERIIYNFAQMKQQGKVTGTELRDLGRGAFMPINEILRKMYDNLGETSMAFEEFRDKASAGAVSVEGFFQAFQDWVAINMPDAAYKLNYTFEAVIQNLHDLFKIFLGWNVLGPTIKSITAPLQGFINRFKEISALAKANAIGKALSFMIDSILEGFNAIGNAVSGVLKLMGLTAPRITSVIISMLKFGMAIKTVMVGLGQLITGLYPIADEIGDKFGSKFSEMSDNFFGWGLNLIKNFAIGIMRGAASFLTSAINFVANLLMSWFKTGSPPQVAPNIDIWGIETMNEWLQGFTEADFDILKGIESPLKASLQALVNLGMLDQQQSIQQYTNIVMSLSQALAEYEATGQITNDIYQQLANVSGVYGEELINLLNLQLQALDVSEQLAQAQADLEAQQESLASAQENQRLAQLAVTAAQLAYDNAVEATAQAQSTVNKSIRNYNDMLRKGAGKYALKNQLQVVNAAQEQWRANQKAEAVAEAALELAQLQLDAAEAQVDAAQAQVDAAQEVVQYYQDQLDLINSQIAAEEALIEQLADLPQNLAESMGGAGDAVEDLADDIGDLSDALGELGTGIDVNFDALLEKAATEFTEEWKTFTDGLGTTFYQAFTDPNSPFQQALGKMGISFDVVVDWLKRSWNNFAADIGLPSWDEIASAWESGDTLVDKFAAVIKAFKIDVEENGGIWNTLKEVAAWLWNKLLTAIADAVAPEEEGGFKPSEEVEVNPGLRIWNWLVDKVVNFVANIEIGQDIKDLAHSLWIKLITAIADNLNPGAPGGFKPSEDVTTSPGARIFEWLVNSLVDVVTTNTTTITNLFKIIGTAIFNGIVQGIIAGAGELLKSIVTNPFFLIFTNALIFFKASSPSKLFESVGNSLIEGLFSGMVKWVSTKWEEGKKAFTDFMDKVKDFFGIKGKEGESDSQTFIDVASSLILGLYNGAVSWITSKWATIAAGWQNFVDMVKTFFGISGAAGTANSSTFWQIAGSIISGLYNGAVAWIVSKWATVAAGWQNFVNMVKTFFGINGAEGVADSGTFYSIASSIILGLYNGITHWVGDKWHTVKSGWDDFIQRVKDYFGIASDSTTFYNLAGDMIDGLYNGMVDRIGIKNWGTMFDPLVRKIEEWVRTLPQWMQDLLQGIFHFPEPGDEDGENPQPPNPPNPPEPPHPPYVPEAPPWNPNIGSSLYQGMGNIMARIANQIAALPTTRMNASMRAAPIYSGNTVTFGDIHIENNMDFAEFKALVHKAIVEG